MKNSLYHLIFLIRAHLPSAQIYYTVNILLKYFSLIMITHNIKSREADTYTLPNFLLHGTFFGKKPYSIYSVDYLLGAIILCVLIICIILVNAIVYVRLKNSNDLGKIKEISQQCERVIQVVSVSYSILCLLSQHLIEYSLLGVVNIIFPTKAYLNADFSSVKKYVIAVLCIVNIALLQSLTYLFYVLSNSTFYSLQKTFFSFIQSKLTFMNMICNFLLGIVTLIVNKQKDYSFIINCALCPLMLIIYLTIFRRSYEHYHVNFATKWNLFLFNWCMVSSLMEIILYYLPISSMTQMTSFNKSGAELLNAVLLTYFTIEHMKKRHLSQFMKKVFNDKKVMTVDEIMAYQDLVSCFAKGETPFNRMLQAFGYHKDNCDSPSCQCRIVSIERRKSEKGPKTSMARNSFEAPCIDFILIGEQAIIRSIGILIKQDSLQTLILQHIDYITAIKKENILGIYYSIQYSNQTRVKLSFWTKYQLYEYQHLIIKRIVMFKIEGAKKHINDKPNEEQTNKANWIILMNNFNAYCYFITKLRKLIVTNLELLRVILQYRHSLSTKGANFSGNYCNCEVFIAKCNLLRDNNEEMINLIKDQKGVIQHYELAYLVMNYFLITHKKIPPFISQIFPSVTSFDYFTQNDSCINSYEEYKMNNPMMIFLDSADQFIIRYVSRRHCNELKFSANELLNKDMSILFQSDFYKRHHLIIKQFALFASEKFRKRTVLLDTNKHLVNVDISVYSLPSLDHNIGVILSMRFNPYKSMKQFKTYTLFLDSGYNILASDVEFEREFFFTVPMIHLMNLSFCDFFCSNKDKMNRFTAKMLNDNGNPDDFIVGDEELKLYSMFKVVKLDTLKIAHANRNFRGKKKAIFHERVNKKDLCKNAASMNKMIKELGLDIEWFTRIKFLIERLNIKGASNYFDIKYRFSSFDKSSFALVTIKEEILSNHFEGTFNKIKKSFKHLGVILHEKKSTKDLLVRQDEGISSKVVMPILANLAKKGLNLVHMSTEDQEVTKKPHEPKVQFSLKNNIVNPIISNENNNTQSSAIANLSKYNSFSLINMSTKKNILSSTFKNSAQNAKKDKSQVIQKRKISLDNWLFNETINVSLQRSYKLLLIILLFMSFFGFLFNQNNVIQSQHIFDINYYSVLIKADVYYASMEMLICCDYADANNETMLKDQRWRLGFRGAEVITHFTKLVSTLNQLSNQPKVSPIFHLFSKYSDYLILLPNFKTKMRQSLLSDELNYIHYFSTVLSSNDSFKRCRAKDMFANSKYENMTDKDIPPNFEEESMFYVLKNVLSGIKGSIEELIIVSNQILHSYHSDCKNSVIMYNSALYVISGILLVNCIVLFVRDQRYIRLILCSIYTKGPTDDLIDEQLSKYLIALDNFSEENCNAFEKKRNSYKAEKKEKELLDKVTQKEDFIDNSKYVHLLYFSSSITQPRIYLFAIIASITFTLIFLIVELFYIIQNTKIFDNLMFSNLISLNVVDRFPTLCELIIYLKISALANNVNLIQIPQDEYRQHSYSNYYNITISTKTNSVFQILGDSYYSYLYYQSLQIKENLETFVAKKANTKLLPHTISIWNQVQEEGGICLVSSVDFSINNPTSGMGLIGSFKRIEDFMKGCRDYGNGIALNKLNVVMDFSLEELTRLYISFATSPYTENKIIDFLKDQELELIVQMENDSMKRLTNVFYVNVLIDMNDLYLNAARSGFMFSMILFFICLWLYVFLEWCILRKIQKNMDIVLYIKKFVYKMLA